MPCYFMVITKCTDSQADLNTEALIFSKMYSSLVVPVNVFKIFGVSFLLATGSLSKAFSYGK